LGTEINLEPSLSFIIPCYNEINTIGVVLDKIFSHSFAFPIEVVVIDDGSTDGTSELLKSSPHPLTLLVNARNEGKGFSLRKGFEVATSTHTVIFDADGEYFIDDISPMMEVILSGKSQVVFGARRKDLGHQYSLLSYYGNKFLTLVANLLFASAIPDLHTCLKMCPTKMWQSLPLSQSGFGLDTEIVSYLLLKRIPIYSVPISYVARTRGNGKKLRYTDGFNCMFVLVQTRLLGPQRLKRNFSQII